MESPPCAGFFVLGGEFCGGILLEFSLLLWPLKGFEVRRLVVGAGVEVYSIFVKLLGEASILKFQIE